MNLSKPYRWALFALGLATFILGINCGGTRDDSLFIDEETFPNDENASDILLDNKKSNEGEMEADEAEVLRLLGINKDEANAPTTKAAPETTATSQVSKQLEADLTKLEGEIASRDRELDALRTQLSVREDRINQLEKELRSGGNSSTYTSNIPKTSVGSGSDSFQTRYQEALNSYNNRNYRSAITEFEALLNEDSGNSLSDNCQYWIGECYYGLGNFNEAIIEFEKVFNFSDSNKFDDSQLKLGLCYLKLGDNVKAKAEFERLLTNYPDSEYSPRAEQYVSSL